MRLGTINGTSKKHTWGLLAHGFWAGRESPIFGSGRPRRPPKPFQKAGVFVPPHLLEWLLGGTGAAQIFNIDDAWPAQNHAFKTQVCTEKQTNPPY